MRRFLPPLLFVAAACVMTWPLAAHPTSRLAAIDGAGDPFLNLWVLGWDLRVISTHPAWLVTGRVFDANMFYPAAGTLAYTDHQIPQALAIWPVYAATGDVTLCYNLVFLLSLALSAWAMYAFIRGVTGSTVAASVAGLAWGFSPVRFAHLPHIQLQALYWMPLTLLALHRFVTSRATRDAVRLGAFAGLQALTSVYYGVIGTVALAVAAALALAVARMDRRLVWRCALAGLVALVVAAPGIWPYWRMQQQEGAGRTVMEAERGSAAPSSYVRAPATNLLYGRSGWLHDSTGAPVTGRDGPEQELFPGLVVTALALVGIAGWRRTPARRPLIVVLSVIGAVGALLSFGPLGIRPLYVLLHNVVPGFQAIRVPARFSVLVCFALAGLAGLGAAVLTRDPSGRLRGWPAVLALSLVGLECLNGSIPYAPAPDLPTPTGRWLRDAPEPGPVVYLPGGDAADDSFAAVDSLAHGRPIVNGHSGRQPALYSAIIGQLSQFPDPQALLTLRDLNIRFVVSRTPVSLPAGPSPVVPRAVLPDGTIYELRWTPELEAAVRAASSPAPLAPGPRPFDRGETARYRVRWVGGPMAIPAGEIVVSADTQADGGFRLTAHVTTASWMHLFFEADDELVTEADDRFLPRTYTESINEGRRRRHRTVEFDAAGHQVTIKEGELSPVTLPLLPEARDPLTALFYIRTLPLEAGFTTRVPINAAGRPNTVDLQVADDSIVVDGRTYDALRVDPTFASHLALARPPHATVWLTRDRRRLPLRIEVSAPFGTVTLELADYQGR